MVPLPPIPLLWVLRGDVMLLPNAEVAAEEAGEGWLSGRRHRRARLPARRAPSTAGRARGSPHLPGSGGDLPSRRGPLFRTVVEQAKQPVVEPLILRTGRVERVEQVGRGSDAVPAKHLAVAALIGGCLVGLR